MASPSDSSRSPRRAASCLLLLPAGYDAPPGLLSGLRQRGVRLREVADAPAAMATLGLAGAEPANVLVIVEPEAAGDAEALVQAVRRYHPRVGVWRYRRGDRPVLEKWPTASAASESFGAQGSNGRAADGNGRAGGSAAPEFSDPASSAAPEASPSSNGGDEPEDHRSLLTDEELTMLLGDDDATDAMERDDRDHFR